jgi:hypothetical protein
MECKVVDWRPLTQDSAECWVFAKNVLRFWVSSITKSVLKSLVSALSTITQLMAREVEKDRNNLKKIVQFRNKYLRNIKSGFNVYRQ